MLSHSLGIKQVFTSPYHPQTNGLTERMNKTIKQVISAYVDPLHQSWDQVLPFAVHAYNTSVQTSTKISPFRALYGRDPHLPPDIHNVKVQPQRNDATEWWLHLQLHQPLLRRALQHNLRMAQQRQKNTMMHPIRRWSYRLERVSEFIILSENLASANPSCTVGLSRT